MEGRRLYTFTVLQLLAGAVFIWVLATWKTPWNAERYVGTVLAVIGISMIALARYQLGTSFSVAAEARHLVTRGLYSKIRNPIYMFGMVMIAGLFLVIQIRALWVVLLAVLIGQTIRARREAAVLEAAFGEEYREYRRKTWF
ncbi:MAG TPA: isoprenylcysteine carboxylmethyltransferase family protein [Candidatus Sulfotelmatobacter sp.]|jgi:protein-S-isoprenylcysteine O-methyltransferase Ste14